MSQVREVEEVEWEVKKDKTQTKCCRPSKKWEHHEVKEPRCWFCTGKSGNETDG